MIKNKLINIYQKIDLTLIDRIFLYTLFLPFLTLITLSSLINKFYINEIIGNYFSVFSVLFFWIVFSKNINKFIESKILNTILFLILIRISINFIYFYTYQLPLSGLNFTQEINQFFGDSGLIHNRVLSYIETNNSLRDIFFNSSHLLNNRGTLVLYSLIYYIYGPYPSAIIAWDSLTIGFYSCIFYILAKKIFSNQNYNYTFIPYLIFLMPAYLIFPLLYRDYYLIFLLGITCFTIFDFNETFELKKYLYLFIFSILLYMFRKVYVVLPLAFLLTFYFIKYSNFRKMLFLMSSILALCIFFYVYNNKELVFISSDERNSIYHSSLYRNKLLELFQYIYMIIFEAPHLGGSLSEYFEKQIFPIKILFRSAMLFLSPFPWTQKIPQTYIIHQILIYMQVFFSLIVFYRLIDMLKQKIINKNFLILICFYIYIFIIAVLGAQQLSSLYVMIALPFLIIGFVNFKLQDFKIYTLYSFITIVLIHISYIITKKMIL